MCSHLSSFRFSSFPFTSSRLPFIPTISMAALSDFPPVAHLSFFDLLHHTTHTYKHTPKVCSSEKAWSPWDSYCRLVSADLRRVDCWNTQSSRVKCLEGESTFLWSCNHLVLKRTCNVNGVYQRPHGPRLMCPINTRSVSFKSECA